MLKFCDWEEYFVAAADKDLLNDSFDGMRFFNKKSEDFSEDWLNIFSGIKISLSFFSNSLKIRSFNLFYSNEPINNRLANILKNSNEDIVNMNIDEAKLFINNFITDPINYMSKSKRKKLKNLQL